MSEKRESEFDDTALEALSIAELEEMNGRVAELIAEKKVTEKAALRGDIEAMLEEHGLDLAEVFEELAPKKRGRRPARPDEPLPLFSVSRGEPGVHEGKIVAGSSTVAAGKPNGQAKM